VYGFPLERATAIALRELDAALRAASHVRRVVCACFDATTLAAYESALHAPER
jgi:O-acetyl-ADP-ribose deacetylase (regulator of RNase III)